MSTYNLIEYNNNYEKTSGSLSSAARMILMTDNMAESESIKFTSKLTSKANKAGIGDIEIAVPLKFFSNFFQNHWSVNCLRNR